uniref:Uncharacterized protein n=1 Tax=Oryza brachyantha TaxID=4533 RepID=J3N998_ORYBR
MEIFHGGWRRAVPYHHHLPVPATCTAPQIMAHSSDCTNSIQEESTDVNHATICNSRSSPFFVCLVVLLSSCTCPHGRNFK